MPTAIPAGAQPHINWRHIDGPLLTRRDGTMKWLTYAERFMFTMGRWDIYDLEKRP